MPDVAELSASRRFVAVENPTALPGCCYTCRNDEGPFVDTGLSEDFFGQVLICKNCILEMAQNFNLPTPEEWSKVVAKNSRLEQKNDTLERNNRNLKGELDGIRTVLGNFGGINSDLHSSSSDATSDVPSDDGASPRKREKERSFLPETSDGSSESDSS